VSTGILISGTEIRSCVPWWAWPLELLHRLVFGKCELGQLPDAETWEGEVKVVKGLPRPLCKWWLRWEEVTQQRLRKMRRHRKLEEFKQRGRLWAIDHGYIWLISRLYHAIGWKF